MDELGEGYENTIRSEDRFINRNEHGHTDDPA
jgi:hypothetical protein